MATNVPEWTVGDRLRKARVSAGLDQREIAEYIGMTHGAIGLYELGRRTPKLGVLRLWAMRCDVDLDWLRTGRSTGWLTAPALVAA